MQNYVPIANGCENCFLCAASSKAHSWIGSGRVLWESVSQKGKSGANHVFRGMSEGSRLFQETHPVAAKVLGNAGRKVRSSGLAVWEHSVKTFNQGVSAVKNAYRTTKTAVTPRARGLTIYVRDNSNGFSFCGGLILVFGIVNYVILLVLNTFYSTLLLSLWFILMAGLLICIPVYFYTRICVIRQEEEEERNAVQLMMDRPPQYECLPPAFSPLPDSLPTEEVPPPTYEELFDEGQGQSNTVVDSTEVCPVHKAMGSHVVVIHTPNGVVSKSMVDLSTDRESPLLRSSLYNSF